ncbi:MAG: hypothetical protein WAL87_04630 [Chthoniobacterales bacterium]
MKVTSDGRFLAEDLGRGVREARKASSITSPSVERRSLDALFASSSNESEMEIVVLMHQTILKRHHDVKLPKTREINKTKEIRNSGKEPKRGLSKFLISRFIPSVFSLTA